MKRILAFLLIFIFLSPIYSEKWVGRASVSKKMTGTKTQGGTIYSGDSFTIACNGFKFGAEVYVISVKTKKRIKVVVNDRIKNDLDFFLLITPKVAKEIGLSSESEIVIVEADFSDINSTERINVNGLINEEEYDDEILKKFPEIKWPEKEKIEEEIKIKENLKIFPEEEKALMIPIKNKKNINLDIDEGDYLRKIIEKKEENGKEIKKEKSNEIEIPLEEKLVEPLYVKKDEKIDTDDIFIKSIKKEEVEIKEIKNILQEPFEEKELLPDKKNEYASIDTYDSNGKKKIIVNKEIENKKIEVKKEEEIKEEPILWHKELEYGKIYIKFSTSLEKKEGDRRYILFRKVFNGKVIGLEKEGKYMLFIGPITKDEIDKILGDIRKYGYKDAYILKWK